MDINTWVSYVVYEDSKPPTCACFCHICGHLQGGELQRICYKNFNLPMHGCKIL